MVGFIAVWEGGKVKIPGQFCEGLKVCLFDTGSCIISDQKCEDIFKFMEECQVIKEIDPG